MKVDEQLMEVFDERMGLQHVLTRARNTETGESLLKINMGLSIKPTADSARKRDCPFLGMKYTFSLCSSRRLRQKRYKLVD